MNSTNLPEGLLVLRNTTRTCTGCMFNKLDVSYCPKDPNDETDFLCITLGGMLFIKDTPENRVRVVTERLTK